jgi:hypothetical protein
MHRVTGPNAKNRPLKIVRPGANAALDECTVTGQRKKQILSKFSVARRGASATWMNAPRDWPKRKKQPLQNSCWRAQVLPG